MKKLLLPTLAAVLVATGCTTNPLENENHERIQTRTGGLWTDVLTKTSALPQVDFPTDKTDEAIHRVVYTAALSRMFAPQDGLDIWNKVSGFFYAWSELCEFNEVNTPSNDSGISSVDQAVEWLRSQSIGTRSAAELYGVNSPSDLRSEGYNDIVATYQYILEKNILYDFAHTPLMWRQAMLQMVIQDLWGGTSVEFMQAMNIYEANSPLIKEILDFQAPNWSRYKPYLPCFSHKDAFAGITTLYNFGDDIWDFGDLYQHIFPCIIGSSSLGDVFTLLDELSEAHFNTTDMNTDAFRNTMMGAYTAAAFFYGFETPEEGRLSILPQVAWIEYTGGEWGTYISSNTNWEVTDLSEGLTLISGGSGKGNGTVKVNVPRNGERTERIATMKIRYSSRINSTMDEEVNLRVTQRPVPYMTFDEQDNSFGSLKYKGLYYFKAIPKNTNGTWSVSGTIPSWCRLNVNPLTLYSGERTIDVEMLQDNNTGVSRSFQLAFNITRDVVKDPVPIVTYFTITQSANDGGFYVEPTTIKAPNGGGTHYFNVHGFEQPSIYSWTYEIVSSMGYARFTELRPYRGANRLQVDLNAIMANQISNHNLNIIIRQPLKANFIESVNESDNDISADAAGTVYGSRIPVRIYQSF